MNALLITLRLHDPILITGVGNGEENSSRSLPYIPGVALRGAIASRFTQKHKPADLPVDETAARLFFSGKVRFLNAYPARDSQDSRALPIPASWRKRKLDDIKDAEARDFALQGHTDFDVPVSRKFCGIDEDHKERFIIFNPGEELAIHIGSQGRGVVKRGESTVFQYQSLARGQRFVAVIVADELKDLATVRGLLEEDRQLFLGRSRAAGYGRVQIEDIRQDRKWQEVEAQSLDGITIITFLSNALLRDEFGQPTHDLDGYLSRRLEKTVKNLKAFVHPELVGGFNRKWGLPLPQFPALGMGSVFVYVASELSPSELAPLVASGIGERRVDGYGRIAVNWPGEEHFYLDEPVAVNPSVFTAISETSRKLAGDMSGRLLHQKLESHLTVHSQKYEIRGSVANHQLSRLRNVLHNILNQNKSDLQPVQDFLGAMKLTAQTQFKRARVLQGGQQAGPRLLNWIQERLEKQDGLAVIGFNDAMIPEVAGQKAALTGELKREYTLRLIEAVIDRKMKQNRKEGM